MFCLSVLLYVDRICISAAKDQIARDLSLDDRQMGWVLSVFALGYALFQTPGGSLADRLGPRRVLSGIVVFWSAFTGLTAAAFNLPTMLATRFLFGAGEAGAFPGIARATYSWLPMQERGVVQGINFSGSRVGGAASLIAIPALIGAVGWRLSFVVLMAIGFAWAGFWYRWFRDDPAQHPRIEPAELDYILTHRQQGSAQCSARVSDLAETADRRLPEERETFGQPGGSVGRPATTLSDRGISLSTVLSSGSLWLVSLQYFCSNFTFFFCLTWLFPHLKATYQLSGVQAGLYSAGPLVCGAFGNWAAGWLVDRIYRDGRWVLSRRVPAMLGFALATVGLVASVRAQTPLASIVWFSLAVFGADMTLAPSWSFCIDIGKQQAGVVSGTMNMAGNLGSFLTALAFPYLAEWTGSNTPFFFVAAGLNALAVGAWLLLDPRRSLEEAR
jgi:ACS family glucarate transporter-like MFS transporter